MINRVYLPYVQHKFTPYLRIAIHIVIPYLRYMRIAIHTAIPYKFNCIYTFI